MSDTDNKFIAIWKIKNYTTCYQKSGECLKSPEFVAENIQGTKWYLDFYPKSNTHVGYCAIHLNRFENVSQTAMITIKLFIEILKLGGETLISTMKITTLRNNEWVGFPSFIRTDKLLEELNNWSEGTLTIRCVMIERKLNKIAIGCEIETNFALERLNFSWHMKHNEYLNKSKKITFSNSSQFEVSLSVTADQYTITITKLTEMSTPQLIYCKIIIFGQNKLKSESELCLFKIDTKDRKFTFANKDEIENGCSRLMFEICSSNSFSSTMKEYYYKEDIALHSSCEDSLSALQDDIRSMYSKKSHSDLQLKIGNESFSAHKFILAARSPIFSAMFEHQMLENQTNQVNIDDADPETMTSFLQFLYTATVDNLDYECALKLLMVADKYQVQSLKEKCALFLMTIINTENVCEILSASDLTFHKSLKECAIEYIISNSSTIFPSQSWNKCMKQNYELGIEIMCTMSNRKSSTK